MTGKERFMKTLRFEEPDRPPHFESMFELEREAFGLQFPDRNSWAGCDGAPKQRQIAVCMEIYQRIVETYHWDALAVYWPWSDPDGVAAAKRTFGERIAIGGMVSDGQLMPVLDQIMACRPHALQSIDPMAGMDIAVVKRLTHGRMALMGNVQCNLLQDGPRAAIRRSTRYCLEHAAPGGGYIFSTSNTIFPGMPLANYEYMLEVFREYCQERTP